MLDTASASAASLLVVGGTGDVSAVVAAEAKVAAAPSGASFDDAAL